MRQFKLILQVFALLITFQTIGYSQTCPAPSINAQAGTGPSTTICSGLCANLTATVVPVNSTTSYSVAAIPYTPFPYVGGTSPVGAIDDVWSGVLNIGFNFCYFGNNFNQLLVGTNGEITFNIASANLNESFPVTLVLPNLTEHPANTICGAYRDINPAVGGNVRTYTTGVAPCRKFVAYWLNVPLYSCNNPLSTFQIVLHESSNIIEVNIQNSSGSCLAWQNGRGLIGIQNAAGTTVTAPPTRNVLTAWTANNESWRFTPTGAPTYTVNWTGPSGFTATGLTANPCPTATGNYTATMNLSNCAGGTITSFTSAVQVSVTPTPTVIASASPTSICAGGSSTLTANGATTYTWQPGNLTGTTIVVNPAATTIYTVTGQTASCTGTTTVQVVVNSTVTASASSNTICSGSSATLTGSGALTYTWNPGNIIGSTAVVSPVANTTYTLTGTNGACTSSTTILITVTTPPTVSAFNLSGTICSGNTATLVGTGALTYTWNPGGLVGNIVNVTPTISTTYTVTGAVGACSAQATILVPVVNGPTLTVIATPTAICSGNSATLSASGALSYTWNPGAIIASSIVITPPVTTTYSVSGINALGCITTNTLSYSVTPTPTLNTISSSTAICAGNSATLSASGATTYTWNPGALVGGTITVTPATNTTYTVVGANGSCTNSKTISIVVNANPTITASSSPTLICSSNSSTLTGTGATSYTWNPGAIAGGTITVTPASTTIYTLTGSNAAGCTNSATSQVSVNITPTLNPIVTPTAICVGSTATLSTAGATSYTWNPGNLTGASVSVSPLITTTYTVTGSNGNCTDTKTVTLIVNPIPTVNATSNPTVICNGSSATLTAIGATSYTWNPGNIIGNPITVNPSSTTLYTVTGSNGSCSSTATVNLIVNPNPTITASASPTNICVGSSATLSSSGATSYTWNPGAITGGTITVSPAATTLYTVTGANGFGCTASNTVNLIVTPIPTVNATASSLSICAGNSTTLTGNGATTYTWNPGALIGTNVTVTPATNTTYTVTGSNGVCSSTNTITITVNPNPTVTAIVSPTNICAGSSATLSSSGATSYTWNPSALIGGTVTVTPASTTLYTVTAANAFGCTATKTVNLIVTPIPTVNPVASPANICIGGSSTLTATGATTYTWNPGALTGSNVVVTPLATTIYTVIGSNGTCSDTKTVTVNVNPLPTLIVTASPTAICSGASSTLSASGAATYTWSPGALIGSPVVVSPLVNTTYTAIGTSSLGCTSSATVTLNVNPIPSLTVTATPTAICSGNSTTLTGVATGGGPFISVWNPGVIFGNNAVVSPASTTTYTWNVQNTFGCTNSKTITINVTPTPTVVVTAGSLTLCSGNSTSLSASGATTYTWNPGAIVGANILVTPLITTTYSVTGSNGSCTDTKTITITVNPNPTLTATASPTNICAGSSATLSSSGATSYTWNPGALIGGTVTVTPATTTLYTVTATNAFGCTATNTVNLIVTPIPTINPISSPANICIGSSSTLTANGATTYTWNPGALTGSNVVVTPIATTIYTVTGSNGTCTDTKTVTVNVNPLPTLIVTASPTAICSGASSTLSASGAATYTWNPGALIGSPVVVSPLVNTTYTVIGTSSLGCTNSKTITLNVNPIPSLTVTATPTAICSSNSTTLTGVAAGGGPFISVWNPGAIAGNSAVVSPATNTTYTWNVTNSFGCVNSKTITINVTPTPTVVVTAGSLTLCSGNSTSLTASGATTYTWNPGAIVGANILVTPLITTTYSVTGSNGSCTDTKTITITVNPNPTLTATASPTNICAGSSATLSSTGATSYTWNPGALIGGTVTVTPASTTLYTVTATNAFGCNATKTVNLIVTPIPVVTASASPSVICKGNSSTLTASGATTYTWNPGALVGTNVVVTPTTTTTYTVLGSNGTCSSSQTLTLIVNPLPTLTITSTPTAVCNGSSATLTANGAASYTWNPGALVGTSVVVSPNVTTTYSVIGMSALGCSSTKNFTLIVRPTPTLNVFATSTTICSGNTTTLNGIAFGGGPFVSVWNPGPIFGNNAVVSPSTTTTYTWNVQNIFGCTNSRTITINVTTTPTVIATASSLTLCSGSSSSLSASGATTYTWNPGALTGSNITVTPTVTTTYSVTGSNGSCTNTKTLTITVGPIPTLTATASATSICVGTSVTFTANGSGTYTWNPTGLTTATITDTPTLTTTYTVSSSNAFGCIGTSTVLVVVNTVPTLTVSPLNATVCSGYATTLTALGATNYTWLPSGNTTSTSVETPTINTTYTVIGANGVCSSTSTLNVFVTPLPANLVASVSASITCTVPTVTLTGSSTSTNVSYAWSGPGSFTSTIQSPTVNIQGVYTFSVIDNITGCIASVTLNVPTDSSIPSVTATASGSITCANSSVTINATTTSTNVSYSWAGPASFTSTSQTFTSTQFGNYTVTVTDLSSTCSTTAMVSVGIHTNVTITASITPATCTGSISNNNGTISLSNFTVTDKYDYVSGGTYTGTATYLTATSIPTTGIVTNTLANPTGTVAYTIRIFDGNGCIKDTTLILYPINCLSVNSLGLAKAVSTPTVNSNGSYDINYKVVVKNYGLLPLNDVVLNENLNNTFPLPSTFSVMSIPIITSTGSSLTIDPAFDGNTLTSLTNSLTSILNIGQSDTIVFGVRVFTNGMFGPFNNSVIGQASPSPSVIVRDSSNIGLDPDPDIDLNPTNNNIPTPIQFTPNVFFGLTKTASLSTKLSDKTYDITYTITVHNLGNDTLKNVLVKDSLFAKTIKYPATYTMKSGPITTGSLTANNSFNGNSDINLLVAGQSIMPPGNINTIIFTINVNPDTVTIFKNSANGTAISIHSITVSDTSNAGNNPDANSNGIWNETADNIPTVVIIPNTDFFIPEGFSPNGDNKNDVWVIKGLSPDVENVLTVYNRWGNKVYTKSNYDNSWNGTPNVNGTLGTEKLPAGTYYYILEFKGGEIKTTNGFVVLQY